MKNIYFIVLVLLVMIYIIRSIRKNKLSISTSFGWFMCAIAMLILAIFPKCLDWLATLIGVTYPPALFLTLCVVVLVIICFNYSKKLNEQKEKINALAQEVSILKEKVNNKK